MAYETKNNTGSIFRNDRREKDTHPHAKGSALIDGVEYWVSAWTKTDKNGDKYQSLAFTAKEAQQSRPKPEPRQERMSYGQASRSSYDDDLSDEVPF